MLNFLTEFFLSEEEVMVFSFTLKHLYFFLFNLVVTIFSSVFLKLNIFLVIVGCDQSL